MPDQGEIKYVFNVEDKDFYKRLNQIEKLLINIDKSVLKTGQNIETAFKKGGRGQREFRDNVDKTTKAFSQQSRVVSQLTNQLLAAFSVFGAQRFVREMIKIRGEFELQHVALSAMLQDTQLANELFEQVTAMALQSPFKILELNKYLKQLKAYRIENESIIEVLGQLGDISAGLGVSMDRLILAYGQVRAASVLRGTELRQFTEAGIPLVDALAKKFTELKGIVVGTDEVFEKITKRQVPFELVKEIFADMTREGGIFYQQQLLQSETLSGQVSILRDAFDKMLNTLGKANQGLLKGGIKGLRSLIESYETILDILKALVTTYGVYKTVLIATLLLENKQAKVLSLITKLQATLNKTILKNPYILIATTITAMVTGLIAYARAQERVNEEAKLFDKITKETGSRLKKETVTAKIYIEQLKNLDQGSRRRTEAISNMNKEYPELLKNINAETASVGELNDAYSQFKSDLEVAIKIEITSGKLLSLYGDLEQAEADLTEEQERGFIAQSLRAIVWKENADDIRKRIGLLHENIDAVKNLNLKYRNTASESKEIAAVLDKIRKLSEEILINRNIAERLKYTGEDDNARLKALEEINLATEKLVAARKELAKLRAGEDETAPLWIKTIDDIIKSKDFETKNLFNVDNKATKFKDYLEDIRKKYADITTDLSDNRFIKGRFKTLQEQNKELRKQKSLIEELANAIGVSLTKLKKGDPTKPLKLTLKHIDEVRKFYLQLQDIAEGTSLEEVIDNDVFSVFDPKKTGDKYKEVYKKALDSFKDADYEEALEELLIKAKAIGTIAGDNLAAQITDRLTDIDETKVIDQNKIKAELEGMFKELESQEFSPLGEGFELSISKITSATVKSLNEVNDKRKEFQDIIDKITDESIRKEEQARLDVNDKIFEAEKQSIKDIQQEKLKSLAASFLDEKLKDENLLAVFKDINNATLKDLKAIKEALESTDVEFSEKIREELLAAGLSAEKIAEFFEKFKDEKIEFVDEKRLEELRDLISGLASSIGELGDSLSTFSNKAVREVGESLKGIAESVDGMLLAFDKKADPVELATSTINSITRITNLLINSYKQRQKAEEDFYNSAISFQNAYNLSLIEEVRLRDALNSSIFIDDWENRLKQGLAAVDLTRKALADVLGDLASGKVGVGTQEVFDLSNALTGAGAGAAIGTVIAPGIGTAIGAVIGGIIAAFGAKETETVFGALLDEFPDLIETATDGTQSFNTALADTILETKELDDATRSMLEEGIDLFDEYTAAIEQVAEVVKSLAGDIGVQLSDSLVDAFVNGTNAAEVFSGSIDDILEKIISTKAFNAVFGDMFDRLEDDLITALSTQTAEDDIRVLDDFFEAANSKTDEFNQLLELAQQMGDVAGRDLFRPDDEAGKGLSKGIRGITEDTAQLLASYFNTIRGENIKSNTNLTSIISILQESQAVTNEGLSELQAINVNTALAAKILDAVYDRSAGALRVA